METLGVAPSKFIFGLTVLCRSALSEERAEGSVREFRNQSLIVVIGNICDPPYFPAKNPRTKATSPNNPCNSQFDLDFPASANFNARSVRSFSFSKAVRSLYPKNRIAQRAPKPPPDLPVLLLLLRLSLLFEAFLRRLLVFLYPFAFLFHNTLLSSVFLCLGLSLL